MSLYNQLLGMNPNTTTILKAIGLTTEVFERFRDCDVLKCEKSLKIIAFARIGGPNRENHKEAIKTLREHPNFLADYDDTQDQTFCAFEFSVPKDKIEAVLPYAKTEVKTIFQRMQAVMDDFDSGIENENTKRARQVGQNIMNQINNSSGGIIRV